jgi:release factor glutamine methyltransferase
MTEASLIRVADLLHAGGQWLKAAGVPGASRDAEWLLGAALGLGRGELHLAADEEVSPERQARFESWCQRRRRREPLQHILGSQPFRTIDLLVDRRVLIPRPETERVVDLCVSLYREGAIMDVGAGSGAIAISLALEFPGARILATDVSAPALALAQENIRRTGVAGVSLAQGDLLESFGGWAQECGLVVCNPPYVATAAIAGLEPEVRDWEPRVALDGGADGLNVYRRLAAAAAHVLRPDAWIVVELGAGQRPSVEAMFRAAGGYGDAVTIRDHAGIERGLGLRRQRRLAG